jgi:hypothetical protein
MCSERGNRPVAGVLEGREAVSCEVINSKMHADTRKREQRHGGFIHGPD